MAGSLLLAALGPPPDNLSIFDPVSPQATAIRDLAFLVMAIVGFIFVLVEGVLIYSIVRFRRTKATTARQSQRWVPHRSTPSPSPTPTSGVGSRMQSPLPP